jgi:hypothetical protein
VRAAARTTPDPPPRHATNPQTHPQRPAHPGPARTPEHHGNPRSVVAGVCSHTPSAGPATPCSAAPSPRPPRSPRPPDHQEKPLPASQ